ncbi:PLP-dependent cysteine synthase family protein [Rhodopseudomonas sp. B29]|uniref:PLP-dependent cysteine synthase family protein n=1 Tax=Rhodopseudomonas sp. B29 TaxID=95607 RepID=UPI00034D57D6|nr:PLP-dependent cysteine synthase family protein [Rhodopseudomonas sp. B29]
MTTVQVAMARNLAAEPKRVVGLFGKEAAEQEWVRNAVDILEADARRSADTHLFRVRFPGLQGLDVYFKDESTHPTGSLKHRMGRSLIMFGLCNGLIGPGTTLVEASSGSTAVSEAYFAELLGLPFIAVVPRSTSRQKVSTIERFGGRCHFVEKSSEVYAAAQLIAAELGGHYLDQFTYAERAIDWRTGNIAESIFKQMAGERHPVPEWIVMSTGTGGTSATIGRYIRFSRKSTRLCGVDVENSCFFEAYKSDSRTANCVRGSRIEGVGRPRVEPSFVPTVIDQMMRVPDAASIAAARVLSARLSRRVGGSTGANFIALCWCASAMLRDGRTGSLVTVLCDDGERYSDTYYNDTWLDEQGIDIAPYAAAIEQFLDSGVFEMPGDGAGFECTGRPLPASAQPGREPGLSANLNIL